MSRNPCTLKILSLLILHFSIQAGCASQPQPLEPTAQELFVGGNTSAVYPGSLDSKNRYSAIVAVRTNAKREDGSENCSGILVSPRDILTAGHCVCMKKKLDTPAAKAAVARRLQEVMPTQGKQLIESTAIEGLRARILANTDTIIDPSLCADFVRVEVNEYLHSEPPVTSDLRQGRYAGKVIHPHPRLLVLEDAAGSSWFREADLALIHLDAPVSERFRSIKLPPSEVQVGNPIIMVGLGFGGDGEFTPAFGDRHHGDSVIEAVQRLGSGCVQFLARVRPQASKPASRVYGGDSGGGCFSKADDRMLLGVISAFGNDGASSIFTSVFAYKEWLKKELSHEGAATIAP
jgi:secreted trypsin-like serine protease